MINSFYGLLIVFSIPAILKRFRATEVEDFLKLKRSKALPSISIIIPAYNEERSIVESVKGILELSYPSKEVIIVDDGSTDKTLELLTSNFDLVEILFPYFGSIPAKPVQKLFQSKLYSNLRVVLKEAGNSKSDAVNVGINVSTSQFFLVIDADTILEEDALLHMIRPFFMDAERVAQGGTIRILNGCTYEKGKIQKIGLPKKIIPGIQVAEYLRSFLYGRLGWNYLGGNVIISGAFGLFNKKRVIECGGYDPKTIAEDFDVTVRLIRLQQKEKKKSGIHFIPDPVAWTLVPDSYQTVAKQRIRWNYGLIEVMKKNKDMIFNPKYKMTGLIAFPYFLFGELLEPFFETFGLLLIGSGIFLDYITWDTAFWYFVVAWFLTLLLTFISIFLEIATFRRYRKMSHFSRLLFFSLLENFGFRQMYLVWRLKSFIDYLRKKKAWK